MSMEFPNPTWSGSVSVQVLDNSGGSAVILDLNDPWTARVRIDVQDPTATLAGKLEVHLFAESYGPGPEPSLGSRLVDVVPGDHVYIVDFNMPANTPAFGGPPAISSFYKFAVVVEHRNVLGNETVIAGVAEGPAIHLRNP
jgi:hypothetical protein